MAKYVFKEAPIALKNAAKADPQVIGAALEKIAEAAGGRLTPPAIVEAAREPRHALHKFFEWDDAAAAEAFRLDQARNIVRSVRIVNNDEDEPMIAFVSVGDQEGRSYRKISEVMGSADLQLAVLKSAERDLDAFQRRYRELADVCSAIIDARAKVAKKREELESRAQS